MGNMDLKLSTLDREAFAVLEEKSKQEDTSVIFKVSRELARQQHKPKIEAGSKKGKISDTTDLFAPVLSIMTEQEKAKLNKIGGIDSLISYITDGISTGKKSLYSKIIIALAQTQFEQSIGSDQKEDQEEGTGISKWYIEQKRKMGATDEEISQLEKYRNESKTMGVKSNGSQISSKYAYIYIDLYKFTKLVNGGVKPGGRDMKAVTDALNELDQKKIFFRGNDGKNRFIRLFTLDYGEEIAGDYRISVRLSPLFTMGFSNDFVKLRKDTLRVLSGQQKDITMRLFWKLVEELSHSPMPSTGYVYRVRKRSLFDEIAVLESYENQKNRREADFKIAVDKMKSLGLITEYREDPGGAEIVCYFTLNKDYEKKAPLPSPET